MASHTFSRSRRDFLKSTGSLTLSLYVLSGCGTSFADSNNDQVNTELPGSLRKTPEISAWVQILEDGRVRIFSGKVELGQGIRIAIKQVAAEELQQDLDQIEVVLAETGLTPDEGYTAGSQSIKSSAMAVRYAAAAAREKLLELAATELSTAVDKLEIVNGGVKVIEDNQQHSFYKILKRKQIEEKVEIPVELIPKSSHRYVGKPVQREDLRKMVTGKLLFIHDLRFPGMLHARVLRPVNYQSELVDFDEEGFRKIAQGVVKTVRNGRFLGVLTEHEDQAERALVLLKQNSKWSEPDILPRQENLIQYIRNTADEPKVVAEKGQVENVAVDTTIKRSYFKPYTMHASMGPACAIALYEDGKLHVWTHSQGIYPLRRALSSMLNMEEDQLHLISVPGAGCFGHTVADDAAADAALLALEMPGRHVRVRWTRQDENRWEPYGSAMIMDLEAGLKDGKIAFWRSGIWSDSHSTRPNQDAGTVLAARHLDTPMEMKSRGYLGGGHRNADPYYDIPNMQITAHFFNGPLRVSSLRSLGAYANVFAIESMMDDLADAASQEPLAFRFKHLSDPRAIAVVEQLRDLTRNQSLKDGEGIGYAFSRYKNYDAYCAVAAKVSVDLPTFEVKLLKCWASVDAGEVINPDGLKNQIEGGIVQAASWTLKEAVTFNEQKITSLDWVSYPILTISETPDIEVYLLDRPNEPVLGGGEVSIPPTGAAIANAIYRACGKRVYELPVGI